MSRRVIQSPGVEIREIDLTVRDDLDTGANIFVMGFAHQGPTDEILQVDSFSSFEDIYGKPNTPAERYFYHSVKGSFDSDANVFVSRLPYGANDGLAEKYSALVYPVVSPKTVTVSGFNAASGVFRIVLDTVSQTVTATNDVFVNLELQSPAGEIVSVNEKFTSAVITFDPAINSVAVSASTVANTLSALSGYTIVDSHVYTTSLSAASGMNASLSASDYYIFGNPTQVELTQSEFEQIRRGEITWKDEANVGGSIASTFATVGSAGMIVVNKGKSFVNNDFEGYYVGVVDNSNFNPATHYDGVTRQYAVTATGDIAPNQFYEVPTTRLDYAVSSVSATETDSVGRTLEEIPGFNVQGSEFDDTLVVGVFKSRITPFSNNELSLNYFLAEGYTGSLNSYRRVQNENGGERRSLFLGTQEENSPNVSILVNPFIANHAGDWTSNVADIPTKKVRTHRTTNFQDKIHEGVYNDFLSSLTNFSSDQPAGIVGFGAFQDVKNSGTVKNIGNVPDKIDRVLNIAENIELWPVDVIPEAGLGTVWVNVQNNTNTVDANTFVDTDVLNIGSAAQGTGFYTTNLAIKEQQFIDIRDDYRTVFNKFETFARQRRKDHVFIADPIRNIFVQGRDGKTLDDKARNFSQHVYWPLRHQFGFANSNYSCAYGNWARTYDSRSDSHVWIPFSGNIAGLFARTDANFAPWYAPMGNTRGVVRGVNSLAIKPTQKQRDQLYRVGINPITEFPNDGILVYGQKTLQRKESAFSKLNVRRLFLDLEKRTRGVMKNFVGDPNTTLTRAKVVNNLTPMFENAKQTEGLIDYVIVCDERNNNAASISRNELIVDIYLKPVHAAEFILVNFVAVNSDVNFDEVING